MTKSMMIPEVRDLPPTDLDGEIALKLWKLMKRDRLSWTEFLRRAVAAYDLMYSRAE